MMLHGCGNALGQDQAVLPVSNLSPKMIRVCNSFVFGLIDPKHLIAMESRLVHDLGVVGDDWDEFYPILKEAFQSSNLIPERFMPSEVSHDAAMVSWSRTWPISKSDLLRRWVQNRIRCPPLTLQEIDAIMSAP